jgi:hypothetical protein
MTSFDHLRGRAYTPAMFALEPARVDALGSPAKRPPTPVATRRFGALQRCGDHACPTEGCAQELQRNADRAGGDQAPPSVQETLRRSGSPLDARARQVLEPRFGFDFGNVRVHEDRSALDVRARAYTVGEHLVFAPGQYVPDQRSGLRLIAHEVAHVVQQRQGGVRSMASLLVGSSSDPAEVEADAAADRAVDGGELPSPDAPLLPVQTGQVVWRKEEKAPQDSQPNSCAGWERDMESFCIAMAKFYYRTDFPNPKSPNPSAVSVKPGWTSGNSRWVNFDNGDTVGIVMHDSRRHATACPKVDDKHPAMPGSLSRECDVKASSTYKWSCSADGQITFSKGP